MSEFGKGIVVCLCKFSEHLVEHGPFSERMIREYADWTPEQRQRDMVEAGTHRFGDSAQRLARMASAEAMGGGDKVRGISRMIEMWMNGASDHFYELDEMAPPALRQLGSLCLEIGHGYTDRTWTLEHVREIRRLWQLACLEVDRMLGIEAD